MAASGHVTTAPASRPWLGRVALLRIGFVLALLVVWEALAASGLLYQDVVPSIRKIAAALVAVLADPAFYRNLGVTAYEVAFALAIGGAAGLAIGILIGGSRFLAAAFEHYLYYLGPTPKIIFFPIMIMWFGVGPGSKMAMGALSCFFPVALSAAAGMREIDTVLIRVGRSFRASTSQMVAKIYLPAMRAPVINGLRLGLGIAIIGVLLAETKLSNQGLGFMIIQAYTLFNMPRMYALLILVFALAALVNAGVSKLDQISAPPARQ
ncbi:MAG TPA: ABC transporter permease [Beijerinckiaceae bacterium]|nr:ABC transporter permease [Beijerinckiaceae bacterium]